MCIACTSLSKGCSPFFFFEALYIFFLVACSIVHCQHQTERVTKTLQLCNRSDGDKLARIYDTRTGMHEVLMGQDIERDSTGRPTTQSHTHTDIYGSDPVLLYQQWYMILQQTTHTRK